jgi:hypothetical protein
MRVDPIEYAWRCCNRGEPFPVTLARPSWGYGITNGSTDEVRARPIIDLNTVRGALLSFAVSKSAA